MSLLTTEQLSELETYQVASSFENFSTSEAIINFGLREMVYENKVRVQKKICYCGNVEVTNGYSSCSKCGNNKFLSFDGCTEEGSVNRTSRLYVTSVTESELIMKRINFSIETLADKFKVKKVTLVREMKVNLSKKSIVIFKNGNIEFLLNQEIVDDYINSKNQRLFYDAKDVGNKMFRGYNCREIANMVDDTIFDELIMFAHYQIGNSIGNVSSSNVLVSLCKMFLLDLESIFKIYSTGIFHVNDVISRHNKSFNIDDIFNTNETKPHKIVGIPKFVVKYYLNSERSYKNLKQIKKIKMFLKELNNNNLARELFEIAHNETDFNDFIDSLEVIVLLHKEYGYKNLKNLVLYLTRTVKMYQGINKCNDAVVILRDYLRMNNVIGIESEKFPKSLKRSHDLTMMNYKSIDETGDHYQMFVTIVGRDSYKELDYTSKESDFVIVSPTEPKDLIDEGDALSHCVGSYVKEVAEEKCKIYFLRAKEEPDKPLATIELRNGNVVQAKTKLNYDLKLDQEEFVQEWAKEKGIYFNKY